MVGKRRLKDWSVLTLREKEFARLWVMHSGSAAKTLAAMGLKGGRAPLQRCARYLNHPLMQGEIDRLLQEVETADIMKKAVTRDWVRSELVDVVNRAKAAVPVKNRNGEETGEWKCDLPSAVRALELLGKEHAMFSDKLVTEDLDRQLEGKSPQEIDAAVKALILEIGPANVERLLREARGKDGDAGSGPDAVGSEATEAGAVPALSEAGGVPSGRILQ